jgi:acyl-coenzyme A thioesterase PaaI-like protein
MVVSKSLLKWLMRLYPPLLFQRIWVQGFDKDFKSVKVKINKSLLNRNPNGSIFGGTIFAAADPFYPVLLNQMLKRKGGRYRIWSKSSRIDFLKPALTDMFFEIKLTDFDIELVMQTLNTYGKYEHTFPVNIYDTNGEVCASLLNEVYVRDLNFKTEL